MSRHLNQKSIDDILEMIIGWKGRFTWDLLVNRVHAEIGVKYTRQTLQKYNSIKDAYLSKKNQIQGEGVTPDYFTPREMEKVLVRLERLEAENIRMKNQINTLLSQLARWAYNAVAKGLTTADLDAPMPFVDRK